MGAWPRGLAASLLAEAPERVTASSRFCAPPRAAPPRTEPSLSRAEPNPKPSPSRSRTQLSPSRAVLNPTQPCQTRPNRAKPNLIQPSRAKPNPIQPSRAVPCQIQASPAVPSRAKAALAASAHGSPRVAALRTGKAVLGGIRGGGLQPRCPIWVWGFVSGFGSAGSVLGFCVRVWFWRRFISSFSLPHPLAMQGRGVACLQHFWDLGGCGCWAPYNNPPTSGMSP